MPRLGQTRSNTDARLSDRMAIGLLTRTFPPELVDQVIIQSGKNA